MEEPVYVNFELERSFDASVVGKHILEPACVFRISLLDVMTLTQQSRNTTEHTALIHGI